MKTIYPPNGKIWKGANMPSPKIPVHEIKERFSF